MVRRDPLPGAAAASGAMGGGGVGGDAAISGRRYDISYQLAEVEQQAQEYGETAAYVALLNALLQHCARFGVGPAEEGGQPCAAAFRFVRDAVFLQLHRRQYKEPAQKWRLAAACLSHFSLLLELLLPADGSAAQSAHADGGMPGAQRAQRQSGPRPPAEEVMADLLSDGPLLRGVLDIVRGAMLPGRRPLLRACCVPRPRGAACPQRRNECVVACSS